jgi:hypothetical protein
MAVQLQVKCWGSPPESCRATLSQNAKDPVNATVDVTDTNPSQEICHWLVISGQGEIRIFLRRSKCLVISEAIMFVRSNARSCQIKAGENIVALRCQDFRAARVMQNQPSALEVLDRRSHIQT